MTTYPNTVQHTLQARQQRNQPPPPSPSPIGYARGYEIDPALEDAIFATRRAPNTTIKRATTTPVQVVRRGNQVLIVEQQQENAEAQPMTAPAPHRTPGSRAVSKQQRRNTAAIGRHAEEEEAEDLPITRPSHRRYTTRRIAAAPSTPRVHWLLPAGIGAAVMLGVYLAGSALLGWGQTTLDDWHYGRPRTFQIDACVGHGDRLTPSHFLALNLNRHVEIVEMPGGDPAHSQVYVGPTLTGTGQELAPVSLTFKDVNGDGKPDMLVTIQNEQLVYLNTGSGFRQSTPADHVTL